MIEEEKKRSKQKLREGRVGDNVDGQKNLG